VKNSPNNSIKKDSVVILDFDGTIYRGICPFLFKGVANVDMALYLLLFSPMRKSFLLFSRLFKLMLFQMNLRRRYKNGKISLSDMDMILVKYFADNILSACNNTIIEKAVSTISGMCYKGALKFLEDHKNECEFVIVSKSFEFLLEKVSLKLKEAHGVTTEFHGVKYDFATGIDKENSVISREKKFSITKDILSQKTYLKKATVIGDTEDDVAIMEAASEVLGKENVTFISVSPKDNKITSASDQSYNSWEDYL